MAANAPQAVVLAAGQGTRLKSKTIKLLHPVAGRPMLEWVLDAVSGLSPRKIVTVIGHQAETVRETVGAAGGTFVLQREQRGTAHAVLQTREAIGRNSRSTLLILNGDLPTLRSASLRRFLRRHERAKAALSVLTAEVPDPTGYGRIVRDEKGKQIERIVEHGDADAATRAIREINTGIYCADPRRLFPVLARLRPENAQGEYYLTDAVRALIRRGETVVAVGHDDAEEVLGVNTRAELAQATATLYGRKAAELLDGGVTLVTPTQTWVDPRARVGRDTTIYPGVIIEGSTRIGEDCTIRAGVRIRDSRLGRGVEIKDHSVIIDSRIGHDAAVGPFAHLRPGSRLDDSAFVGNFVELKKTRMGRGAKASHLTYLGDAEVGAGTNVGAGTITCNYDGKNKFKTTLKPGAFIGSNTQIVAPVTVGRGAYVAAGSTVTEDVPDGALAVARSRQRNIAGWARKGSGKGPRKKK